MKGSLWEENEIFVLPHQDPVLANNSQLEHLGASSHCSLEGKLCESQALGLRRLDRQSLVNGLCSNSVVELVSIPIMTSHWLTGFQ